MNRKLPAAVNDGMPAHPTAILLAEDMPVIRHLYCSVLLAAGYHVYQANDAAEAKAIVTSGVAIHLLLADYNMPGLNGAELGRWFQRQLPGVPVIVISASVQSVQAASRELTTVFCFLKPSTPQDLLGIVRNALESPAPAAGGKRTP